MISFNYSDDNFNFSFSESIASEDSEIQNNQPCFDNFIIPDGYLQINFLRKKKKRDLLTNEFINGQYSQDLFASERDNKINEINKSFQQEVLNSSKTENVIEENYSYEKYLQIKEKPNEFSNLTSFIKENEPNEVISEKKMKKFLVIKEKPKKPRGRKRKSKVKNKMHSNNAFDNIISKVQIHFITFIIKLANDIIEREIKKEADFCFADIDHSLKKKITYDYFEILKKLQIKDILQKKITSKSKFKNEEHNKEIYQEIIKYQDNIMLKEALEMNYLDFFKKFYYNEGKKIEALSIQGKEIKFSEKLKPFYKLYKNDIKYNQKLIKFVKCAYFGEVHGNGRNVFKTSSQSKINN